MFSLAAIDQSITNSGVAMYEVNEQCVTLKAWYLIKPKSTGIRRLIEIKNAFERLCEEYEVSYVIREQHNLLMHGAGNQLHGLNALLDEFAFDNGFVQDKKYLAIPSSSWKKFISGKGNLAKDTAYLMKLNKALSSKNWLHGIKAYEDDNIADAVCIGATAAFMIAMIEKNYTYAQCSLEQEKYLRKSYEQSIVT